MSDKKRHTRGYSAAIESNSRRAQARSFKKFIEDVRIQEALEEVDDFEYSANEEEDDQC